MGHPPRKIVTISEAEHGLGHVGSTRRRLIPLRRGPRPLQTLRLDSVILEWHRPPRSTCAASTSLGVFIASLEFRVFVGMPTNRKTDASRYNRRGVEAHGRTVPSGLDLLPPLCAVVTETQ
jgi:hypothetical protein